jgi:hypothetical protein
VPDSDINEFIEAAKRFCAAAEARASSPDSVAGTLSKALVAVYASALDLPEPQPTTDKLFDASDRPTISPVANHLRAAFGVDDTFMTVYDATDPDPDDPYKSSLAQELGEIYEDLKEAIALIDEHGPTADCVWQVKFDFEQHWGQHAMHVLPALHQLRRFR